MILTPVGYVPVVFFLEWLEKQNELTAYWEGIKSYYGYLKKVKECWDVERIQKETEKHKEINITRKKF